MTPRFSIIVPVYKTEQYLRQCVDSILGQSYTDFEVVLVDDGSPDGSGGICDEYAARDHRVKVIHKENGGLVSARQAGAALCTGAYVVNVDSDDYIATDLLEQLAQIIDTHDPDVVVYDGYRFTGDTQADFCGSLPAGLYKGASMSQIRSCVIQDEENGFAIVYGICMKAVRREKYVPYQLAVPEKISIGEDLAVTAPLLVNSESVFVSGIQGYYYRDNPKSIMNTFRKSEAEQIRLLADYLLTAMGEDYQDRIDAYVLLHYFDFLDRAMLQGWRAYRQIIRQTRDAELAASIRRARCSGGLKLKVIFFLMRHKCYNTLWLLRRIKKRV